MDCSEPWLPPLRRDFSSLSPQSDCDDNVAPRESSEGAVGQAESIGSAQGLQVRSELNVTDHGLCEGNMYPHNVMRPLSSQACRSGTSIAESPRESTRHEQEVPDDENDPCAKRSSGTELCAGHTTDGRTSRSDDHSALLSSSPRNLGKHRVKENSTRRLQLPIETRRNDTSASTHERRMRVEKRRRAPFGKRHTRLRRTHSADSRIVPNQSIDSGQSGSEKAFWKEHKSYSISGPITDTEVNSSHVSGHPAAIPDGQLPGDAGLLPGETSTESLSSCDETETDVSETEQPHPLDPHRDHIVSLLLQRYVSFRTGNQQQDTDSKSNGTESVRKTSDEQSQSKTSRGKQAAGQKRKRNSGSQDDDSIEDEDEAGPRRRKSPKSTTEESTEHQSFACPFSKKSPSRYRRCYRYDLKRIRDVKQHLRRCHRRAVYCPVCSETFDSEEARDTHVRQRNCVEKSGFTVEGISDLQAQSLSGKCSTRISAEEQWFHVFDICFPGHAHPRSPYVDRHLSEELQSFRDFASTEGPSIMLEEMRGFREWNDEDTAFLRQVLSDGLESIADQWSQGLDSERTPDVGTTSSASAVPRPSPQTSSARQSTPPQVSGLARDCQRGAASAITLENVQEQLLGISSGDNLKLNNGVGVTQAENTIYDFSAELFDFNMLSNGAPVVTAPGEVDYPLDLWTLRYGPNVELAT